MGIWANSRAQATLPWRTEMADHAEVEYATATSNDYAEHENTYLMFTKMTRWGIGILVVLLILMGYFLT
jgi:hypothetical protein